MVDSRGRLRRGVTGQLLRLDPCGYALQCAPFRPETTSEARRETINPIMGEWSMRQQTGIGIAVERWRSVIVLLAFYAGSAFMTPAAANVPAPHELVSAVIDRVLERLETLDGGSAAPAHAVLEVFEQELTPHLDFATITRWMSGPRWQSFSEGERADLTGAIRTHIIHVYSSLLAHGRDVAIDVQPNSTLRKRSAKVPAMLATTDGRNFQIEFRLLQSEDTWRLYDLVVDGVSFARSLQAEIGPVIAAEGVRGVKAYLAR
jgi:phospholipid transport system substrate-binding protein